MGPSRAAQTGAKSTAKAMCRCLRQYRRAAGRPAIQRGATTSYYSPMSASLDVVTELGAISRPACSLRLRLGARNLWPRVGFRDAGRPQNAVASRAAECVGKTGNGVVAPLHVAYCARALPGRRTRYRSRCLRDVSAMIWWRDWMQPISNVVTAHRSRITTRPTAIWRAFSAASHRSSARLNAHPPCTVTVTHDSWSSSTSSHVRILRSVTPITGPRPLRQSPCRVARGRVRGDSADDGGGCCLLAVHSTGRWVRSDAAGGGKRHVN